MIANIISKGKVDRVQDQIKRRYYLLDQAAVSPVESWGEKKKKSVTDTVAVVSYQEAELEIDKTDRQKEFLALEVKELDRYWWGSAKVQPITMITAKTFGQPGIIPANVEWTFEINWCGPTFT